MKNALLLATAVAAAVSGPLMVSAQAADNEKCFGVAAAGQNEQFLRWPSGRCRPWRRLDLCADRHLREDQRRHPRAQAWLTPRHFHSFLAFPPARDLRAGSLLRGALCVQAIVNSPVSRCRVIIGCRVIIE